MGRAERRRAEKEAGKKQRVYTLTQEQLDKVKEEASKEAIDTAFTLMLALPMEILIGDGYWPKSGKKRIPKFLEEVLSLYECWEKGVLTLEELREDLWKWGGIKLEAPKGAERY